MLILAIETSCDETSVSIVENGSKIISNVVSSQIDIHSRYGGIVPEVASRQHLLSIIPVLNKALKDADCSITAISAIAVTHGPGLAGSLLVGVNIAKAIAWTHRLPLIGVNHLEGHIYANWLNSNPPEFPCLCLIASGGHSDLLFMSGHGHYQKLGRTRDDAAGEAFDKASRILGLGYPGGPAIEQASGQAVSPVNLPRAWLKGTDDFSFSGLKTALLNLVQSAGDSSALDRSGLALGFQQAVIEVLITKTIQAAKRSAVKKILISGGVAANKFLREYAIKMSPVPVSIPPPILCTDNAAMIASCAYYHLLSRQNFSYDLDVIPSLNIG